MPTPDDLVKRLEILGRRQRLIIQLLRVMEKADWQIANTETRKALQAKLTELQR